MSTHRSPFATPGQTIIRRAFPLAFALAISTSSAAQPAGSGFSVEVLVDGRAAPVYAARGTRYVEAIKGAEYAIRLRNPLGVRVAVALSVDGLNTIDARRTSAPHARKWVLDPYETMVISGWQTSTSQARRFYFTSEEQSYAQSLGRTSDMGIISAVFYRERVVEAIPITSAERAPESEAGANRARPASPAPPSATGAAQAAADSATSTKAEEYAATGIGRHTEHRVQQVSLDLERTPAATLDLRYEFRPQLVKLGVLPPTLDQITRRERARGFEKGFCPEPR